MRTASAPTARMLAELSIDDLVLIAGARLRFAPGLNVITGETGAGKSLLAQAVGLLMGQKGSDDLVRSGAERAVVQAVFEEGDESFAVARELPSGGRSRAFINGLTSSAAAVEEALRERVAFYGQLEHARLLHLDRQLDLLDAAAADVIAPLAAAHEQAHQQARELERRLNEREQLERDRDRELDLLRFQVDEIERAQVQPGEDERLAVERERLRHAEKLLERVGSAITLLAGETEANALDGLRGGRRLLADAAALDVSLAGLAERLDAVAAETEDVELALRAYVDELDADPAHRDAVELRHDQLQALKRKYGASADKVLEHLDAARDRLTLLERSQADEGELRRQLAEAKAEALAAAAQLSAARTAAGPGFAQAVQRELRALSMPHALFEVSLVSRGEGWAALGPRGVDEAEFLFSANPGMQLRPLRETASGGELSRAMLALKTVATLTSDVGTLIFDEVDTGIGGVTATGLGERLANLADNTQILCITHLPQVVAFADRHFAITKLSDAAAGTTETVVREVEGEERLAELCRMLGAVPQDEAARRHAEGLLARARERVR
jgi:DNA repair protein RecN (Recombination protein N)